MIEFYPDFGRENYDAVVVMRAGLAGMSQTISVPELARADVLLSCDILHRGAGDLRDSMSGTNSCDIAERLRSRE
jgi:hypothetical protein